MVERAIGRRAGDSRFDQVESLVGELQAFDVDERVDALAAGLIDDTPA